MKQQVFSLPELIEQQYAVLEPKVRTILTTPELFSVQRILLTGCGDSYAVALAVKHAFEALTGIPTDVVTAIELARFYDAGQLGFAPRNPLVIAISNSGTGARVCEAVQRANGRGCMTLAMTGNAASPLAHLASRTLLTEIPAFPSELGIRYYLTAVMTLLLFAIRLGEVRGRYTMDQATAYREDIRGQGAGLRDCLPEMDCAAKCVAEAWKEMEAFDFIGSGLDYAAAWFGHAKVFEALGKYAMHINTEEWLHLNFFMRKADNIATIVVANTTNPANSRTRELLHWIAALGRPALLITDGTAEDFDTKLPIIRVPGARYPATMAIAQYAPIPLIISYLQDLIGEENGRGCRDRWSFCDGGACVKNSEIIVLP